MAGSSYLQNPGPQKHRGQWEVEPHQNIASAESARVDRRLSTTTGAYVGHVVHLCSRPRGLWLAEAVEEET